MNGRNREGCRQTRGHKNRPFSAEPQHNVAADADFCLRAPGASAKVRVPKEKDRANAALRRIVAVERYAVRRRYARAAKSNPVPSSDSVAGSGTTGVVVDAPAA
jgi:hypothetical protein